MISKELQETIKYVATAYIHLLLAPKETINGREFAKRIMAAYDISEKRNAIACSISKDYIETITRNGESFFYRTIEKEN